jgi:hypothetical protein
MPTTSSSVNDGDGADADLNVIGLISPGDTLPLTLARTDNRHALTVENRSTGAASTLTIRHPGFLDHLRDLPVGIFGANTASSVRRTLVIREVYVTVRRKVAAGR